MSRTLCVAAVIVGLVGVVAPCGCKKQPAELSPATRVSLERPMASARAGGDWSSAVYPARYADPELPAFPPEAVEAAVAHATVRADFTVLPDGRAHDVRLELTAPVPEGERFVAACAAVLERWRFSPAWRLARPDEKATKAVVLLPSKAHLIFHFDLGAHLDGRDVEMSFEPGGPL